MHRRHLLGLLATAPLLSVARADDGPMPVAVNQTTIESGPLLIGNPPGLRVVRMPNGRAASAQLVGGQVDAATGSETQATLSAVLQPQLRIILTLAECHYRMVGRRSAGLRGIADLRGKRVAYTPATSSEYFLRVMLESAGLTLADVTPVKLEPEAMPPALAQGRADAMAMWEPHPQNAIDELGKDAIVMTDPRKPPHAYFERFNLNTTTAVLNDPRRRAALVRSVQTIAEVSRELGTHPRKYWPALSKAVNAPVPVIEKTWPQFRFPARLDTESLMTVLTDMEPWAAAVQQRAPRTRQALARMMDASVARDAGR
ncbi:SsuA/THI5-like domain-containing protein [Bordetella sputigena]|uniref:ABC transporter substrate-binding protein n=1 Tax=Bordetella sputigena TaxID=1416810 RepID=UPI0039F084AB